MALPKNTSSHLETVTFPDLARFDGVESKAFELGKAMEAFIQARKEFKENPTRTQAVKNIMQKWYRACYPFAQAFLAIAKTGASVVPSDLCDVNLLDSCS